MNHDEMLTGLHASTADDLNSLLDVEAGLREALVAAQHTNTVHDLDLDLDVEAGLRAIAPASETSAPSPSTSPSRHTRQPSATPASEPPESRGAVANRLISMDSASRLALRNDPAVAAFAMFLEIAAAKTLQRLPNRDYISALRLASDYATDLADTLYPGEVTAIELARDRARGIDRFHAYELASGVAGALERALSYTGSLARAPGYSPDYIVALNWAHDYARDLARHLIRDLAPELERDIAFALHRDRDVANDIARIRNLTRNLDIARHDFTDADLRGVNLRRESLTGVRWSMTTKWPSDEWRDQALLDSRDLGDGTYEIRGGTTNVPVSRT